MQNPRSYRWAKQPLYRSLQLETHSDIRLNCQRKSGVGWWVRTHAERRGPRRIAKSSEPSRRRRGSEKRRDSEAWQRRSVRTSFAQGVPMTGAACMGVKQRAQHSELAGCGKTIRRPGGTVGVAHADPSATDTSIRHSATLLQVLAIPRVCHWSIVSRHTIAYQD